MICPFSVVESRWWSKGNHSVRPLFEAVASIHFDNPSAFYYDMFADKSSLKTVLTMRGNDAQTEVIYLASHGNETQIGPNSENTISRTEVRNIIVSANTKKQIKGLFLGTCLTGNIDVARFFLENAETNLEWVAGYSNSVDWVDGSAVDMIFFSKLAEKYVANKSKKKGKLSPRKMAHETATALVKLVQGAHSVYGFNIYFHENKKLTSMFT
jgi:hypothetical protein